MGLGSGYITETQGYIELTKPRQWTRSKDKSIFLILSYLNDKSMEKLITNIWSTL